MPAFPRPFAMIGGVLKRIRPGLALFLVPVLAVALAACSPDPSWRASDDITGGFPSLDFTMTRAGDGKQVTEQDYRGKITLLYFGYTNCPDVCPTTLLDLSRVLKRLGPEADDVRVLFVTVDPARDTLDVLKKYVGLFGPQMVGLRGTQDQLARLGRRNRIAWSVTPGAEGEPPTVIHSSAIYVYDRDGTARLLVPAFYKSPDVDGLAADLRRLIEGHQPGFFQRVLSAV